VSTPETKICRCCGRTITRGTMSAYNWKRRVYCDRECNVRASAERWKGKVVQMVKPWAKNRQGDE
jgi:hypothetical protein